VSVLSCHPDLASTDQAPFPKNSPVQSLLLDIRAGVLADRDCREQCQTSPSNGQSGMNFPWWTYIWENPAHSIGVSEGGEKLLPFGEGRRELGGGHARLREAADL
jgi:hypothetical protein